jgi:uncharacterized protein
MISGFVSCMDTGNWLSGENAVFLRGAFLRSTRHDQKTIRRSHKPGKQRSRAVMNFSREVAFILFRIVLPILIFIIQVFLYRRMSRWLHEKNPTDRVLPILGTLPFVLFNGVLVAVFVVRPRTLALPSWLMVSGVFPFIVWQVATFFIGVMLFLGTLVAAPVHAFIRFKIRKRSRKNSPDSKQPDDSLERFDATRRVFLRRTVYGLTAVSFTGTTYGLIQGKTVHEITSADFEIAHLPPALDGFTIGLISDIHSSIFMTKPEMDTYVELVNALHTDLIVVPGDFVNSLTEEVYAFAESFSNLRAPLGVYGVMGNHDYYVPAPGVVAKEVNACGIHLLHDDRVIIRKNGAAFCLLGIDDARHPHQAEERIARSLGHSEIDMPKILLSHRPYFLPQAAEKGVDLVLSGHTHGGQIVLGRFGSAVIAPASLASPYVWGKYRTGNTQMYVSRGIGTVGVPIRFNCPPEITRITLSCI